MIDWSKGYTATYTLSKVNRKTWADDSNHELIDGSVDRDSSKDLIESASITLSDKIGDGEEWVRIYLHANQEGTQVRAPLFTGLTSMPERKLNGSHEEWSVDCYSVLKPAADKMLDLGYYAQSGSGADKVRELLSCTPAPIVIDGLSPTTTSSIVAEQGETALSMAQAILDAINWRLKISGDGTITICEKAKESSLTIGQNVNDVVETELTDTYDWYSIPNVLRASSDDDGSAVARDDDPNSSLSTVTRGREIWVEDKNVSLSDGETIAQYAARRLTEEQAVTRKISYSRRFMPDIYVGDMIEINYPAQGIVGTFEIASQGISLEYGARTEEEVNGV